jgi:hypothetical protein
MRVLLVESHAIADMAASEELYMPRRLLFEYKCGSHFVDGPGRNPDRAALVNFV